MKNAVNEFKSEYALLKSEFYKKELELEEKIISKVTEHLKQLGLLNTRLEVMYQNELLIGKIEDVLIINFTDDENSEDYEPNVFVEFKFEKQFIISSSGSDCMGVYKSEIFQQKTQISKKNLE